MYIQSLHRLGCWGLNAIQVFQEPRTERFFFDTGVGGEKNPNKEVSVKIIPKSFMGNSLKKVGGPPPRSLQKRVISLKWKTTGKLMNLRGARSLIWTHELSWGNTSMLRNTCEMCHKLCHGIFWQQKIPQTRKRLFFQNMLRVNIQHRKCCEFCKFVNCNDGARALNKLLPLLRTKPVFWGHFDGSIIHVFPLSYHITPFAMISHQQLAICKIAASKNNRGHHITNLRGIPETFGYIFINFDFHPK